ncbi:Ribonuclease [Dirofilaria immitis]
MKTSYYAVVRGHCVGVYKTWPECERQVKGYRNARYKRFATQSDAIAFILQNNATRHTGTGKSSRFELSSTTELQKSPCSQLASQNMWEKVPVVYTDGACSYNGRLGVAAGIGIYWGEQHVDNISEPLLDGPLTNNRAELIAVIRAIQTAIQRGYQRLIVRTDSSLLIQTMNLWIHRWRKNGWKTSNGIAVKNQDLIIQLDSLVKNINVRFEHVFGHMGIFGNEKADQLARKGAARYRQIKF